MVLPLLSFRTSTWRRRHRGPGTLRRSHSCRPAFPVVRGCSPQQSLRPAGAPSRPLPPPPAPLRRLPPPSPRPSLMAQMLLIVRLRIPTHARAHTHVHACTHTHTHVRARTLSPPKRPLFYLRPYVLTSRCGWLTAPFLFTPVGSPLAPRTAHRGLKSQAVFNPLRLC